MSFDALPTELYEAIFGFLDPADLRQTIVNVSQAIPLAPLPLEKLFRSVRLTRPEQAILLYNRIRPRRISTNANTQDLTDYPTRSDVQAGALVKELAVETWAVDADILINLVRLLPNLQSLIIWIGPTNFTPEHLEELLSKPFKDLRYLSLRFRPYVEKATYYQFLKGAYFDSTLTALSLWPPSGLTTLSIIQDPLDSEKAKKQGFAQPIVFFRLDLLPLLHSPAFSQSLKYLRLRIPFRAVARSLCGSASSGSPSDSKLPSLEFLDLSTCGISEAEIDIILARFTTLKHVILDGCSVLRGDLREGESIALGKSLALVGVKRAKDKERELKAWLESKAVAEAIGSDGAVNQGTPADIKRPKPGRKGLATATLSFRTEDPPLDSSKLKIPITKLPVSEHTKPIVNEEPPVVSSKTSVKGKHTKLKEKKHTASSKESTKKKMNVMARIRVLPTFATLQSLSLTLSASIKEERHPTIRAEFEEGWAEGIAQIARIRARLRTSSENGFRVMRICSYDAEKEGSDAGDSFEEGLYGLEDVDKDSFGMPDEDIGTHLTPPVLCFVGPLSERAHETNCGHAVGWEVMKDEY